MANINVRSPYLIRSFETGLEEATLRLWIYRGTQLTSHTVTPTYTLTSTAINEEAVFDIAPLVKDYFGVNLTENFFPDVIWVDYSLDKLMPEDYYSAVFNDNNDIRFIKSDDGGIIQE